MNNNIQKPNRLLLKGAKSCSSCFTFNEHSLKCISKAFEQVLVGLCSRKVWESARPWDVAWAQARRLKPEVTCFFRQQIWSRFFARKQLTAFFAELLVRDVARQGFNLKLLSEQRNEVFRFSF